MVDHENKVVWLNSCAAPVPTEEVIGCEADAGLGLGLVGKVCHKGGWLGGHDGVCMGCQACVYLDGLGTLTVSSCGFQFF